jgi:hypothetical protein
MFYRHARQPETRFFFNDRDAATNRVFTVLYDVERNRRVREYRFVDAPAAKGGVSPEGGILSGDQLPADSAFAQPRAVSRGACTDGEPR